jgi:hypothetical protein
MSRIWYENYLPHGAPVKDVNSPIGRVLARKIYFVEVCSFKFEFYSIEQMKETLAYFEQKTHPSSRLPDEEWINAEARKDPKNHRRKIDAFLQSERDVLQRWYERLPMWLYEEPKRQKVVKVLKQAIDKFSESKKAV